MTVECKPVNVASDHTPTSVSKKIPRIKKDT